MRSIMKRYTVALFAVFASFLLFFGLVTASAEEDAYVNANITVTYDQTEARAMLEYINLFRTGQDVDGQPANYINPDGETYTELDDLQPLSYDYGLEQAAMQRAAEIVMRFNHPRPNGTSCFEVLNDFGIRSSFNAVGENIAAGTRTAYDTFRLFREDNDDYSGQGHRRNMLNNNFTRIGIGHAVYSGFHFWVQVLGRGSSGSAASDPKDAETEVVVQVSNGLIEELTITGTPDQIEMEIGETQPLPEISAELEVVDDFPVGGSYGRTVSILPTWSSGDSSVLSISSGQMKAVKKGTTTISATVNGQKVSAEVHVYPALTGLSIDPSLSLKEGETKQLEVTFEPSDAPDPQLLFSSSDETVATVDENGSVTAVGAGKTTVRAASKKDASIYAEATVSVSHKLTTVNEKMATCKNAGTLAHYNCSVCGKSFADASASKELTEADLIIAKLDHTPEVIPGKEATCTESGLTEGSKCSVCGEILKEQEMIEKIDHTPEVIPGKEATCTESGLTEGSKCSVCGEILKEQEAIEKKAHSFSAWKVTKEATVIEKGEEERICADCGKKENRTIAALEPYFNDVKDPDAWFYKYVYQIADTRNKKGSALMSGYKDGSGNFGPTDPLTRQDFAVILFRMAEEPSAGKTNKSAFPDADTKGYYYDAIVWAKDQKVITGYNDGRFGVGDNITREQVATILYRYSKDSLNLDVSAAQKEGEANWKQFKDYKAVSEFATDALQWANGAGIVTGKDNGTKIDPQGNAARAEIAAMVLRFQDYLENHK